VEGTAASIGTVGDAYCNSLMETIIGLFKTEAIRPGPFHHGPLKNSGDVEFTTMAWVDWFNRGIPTLARRHGVSRWPAVVNCAVRERCPAL